MPGGVLREGACWQSLGNCPHRAVQELRWNVDYQRLRRYCTAVRSEDRRGSRRGPPHGAAALVEVLGETELEPTLDWHFCTRQTTENRCSQLRAPRLMPLIAHNVYYVKL